MQGYNDRDPTNLFFEGFSGFVPFSKALIKFEVGSFTIDFVPAYLILKCYEEPLKCLKYVKYELDI